MGSHAATGRAEFVEALRGVPPTAPTLCEGWTALDLAAHVVARERRPDSGPGLVVRALSGWTERVRAGYARRPYRELIDLVAAGPPWTSPFALPGVDEAANATEFLIHTEDVLRARPGWEPRDLPADRRDAVWTGLRRAARLFFRRSPVPLVLTRPDGARITVGGAGDDAVGLTGEPEELLLLASGRRDHARVAVDGPPDAVRAFRELKLGL